MYRIIDAVRILNREYVCEDGTILQHGAFGYVIDLTYLTQSRNISPSDFDRLLKEAVQARSEEKDLIDFIRAGKYVKVPRTFLY